MEFFKKTTKIDFMRIRFLSALFSAILILASCIALVTNGINWGLDFTGGIVVELGYHENASLPEIREKLKQSNYHDVVVQSFGTPKDVIIRLAPREGIDEKVVAANIVSVLTKSGSKVDLKRAEIMGAQVGRELAEQGALALLVAILAITVYITTRFEMRFAIASAVALAHDPIVILGLFAFYQVEFDLTTLAGMLAVIGYSLNDTIVIFDRVKENFIKLRNTSAIDIVNLAINQTLSRTIMTSGLTLLVVIALLIFGGPTLYGFALSLFIGIIVGTYSSIYIAGSLAVTLGLKKSDLLPSKKEVDLLP